MNTEVIKAMNKTEKKQHPIRIWWNNNSYKVWRVILFPVWIGSIIKEKVQNKLNAHQVWSDERAKEIFDYYVPRRAKWHNDEKCFYFFDNGMGWNRKTANNYLKRKDRRFWRVNGGYCGGKLRHYLIDNFELEGFEKAVEDCSNGWTEITFTMIEKN